MILFLELDLDMHQPETIGSFRIIARLSEGGHTEKLLAHDQHLGREVIITRLTGSASQDVACVEGFKRRIKQLGRIEHPNVVPVHAIDLESSQPYFVTARVDGETLDALLRRSGPLELNKSVQIILDILDGLSAAHDQHVSHGNLTTRAVFIERSQGRALLGNFAVIPARHAYLQYRDDRSGDFDVHSSHPWNCSDQERRDDLRCLGRLFLSLLTKERAAHSGVTPSAVEYEAVSVRLAHAHSCVEAPPEVWELVLQLLSDSVEADTITSTGIRERLARVHVNESMGDVSPQYAPAHSSNETWDFKKCPGTQSPLSRWLLPLRWIAKWTYGELHELQRRQIDFGEEDRQHSILLGYRKDGLAALADLTNHLNGGRGQNGTLLAAIAEQRGELAKIDRLIQRLGRRKARRSRTLPALHSAVNQFDSDAANRRWKPPWLAVAGIAMAAILSMAIAASTKAFRSHPLDVVATPFKAFSPTSLKTDSDRIIDQYYEHGRLFTEVSSPLHESRMVADAVAAIAFDPARERLHAVTRQGILETLFVSDGLRQKPSSPWSNVADASQIPGTDMVIIRHQDNAAAQGQHISIIDSTSGQSPLLTLLASHGERVVGFQREPLRLWTLSSDGQQRLLEYNSEGRSTQVYQFDDDVTSLVVGQNATCLAAIVSSHEIELIEPGTGMKSRLASTRTVDTLASDTSGHWLAAHGRNEQTIQLFSTRRKRAEASLTHEQAVRKIQFDREGRRLAVATDQDVRIWDLALCYVRIRVPVTEVRLMQFSADGGRLAVLRESGQLSVWDTEFPVLHTKRRRAAVVANSSVADGRVTATPGKESAPFSRVVTSDGRLTVKWNPEEGAVLEETDSGHVLLKYSFTTPSVVAISPDDRLVAFGRVDERNEQARIAICDLRTGRVNREVSIGANYLFCLEFSASQDVLYGGGLRTIYAWESATGDITTQYTTSIPYVYRVHRSLDGRRLVVSDHRPQRPIGEIGAQVLSVHSGELLWDASANEWPNLIRPLEELVDTRFGEWEAVLPLLTSAENK